jgi:CRISPR/Cas system-associated exonuclease Cas4 (RecB family)
MYKKGLENLKKLLKSIHEIYLSGTTPADWNSAIV